MTLGHRRLPAYLVLVLLMLVGLPQVALGTAGPPTVRAEPPALSALEPTAGSVQVTPNRVDWGRLEGRNRMVTAVQISRHRYPAPSAPLPAVYVARSDVPADALAGGALRDGPVLLVPRCAAVPQEVTDEVRRLDPQRVIALGGSGAVCDTVLGAVASGRPTSRLEGQNRYATAVAISRRAFPDVSAAEVYVASGADAPDAVAGGVLTRGPLLLVPASGAAPAVVLDEVRRLRPQRVVGLGGTGALADATLSHAAQDRPTTRLQGTTRYATAAAIARYAFPRGGEEVYLARGDVFADAIAGGSLDKGPILLVPPGCGALPAAVADYLREVRSPRTLVVLGGTGAVCDDTGFLAAELASLRLEPQDASFVLGDPASLRLTASRGTGPFSWTAMNLPAGLTLSSSGLLTGTPTQTGVYEPVVRATDAVGRTGWFQPRVLVGARAIPSPGPAAQVSAGGDHSCAVDVEGALRCWGDNTWGQLGDGTTTDRVVPTPVVGMGADVLQVTTGNDHTCAVRTDGSAWCWGFNSSQRVLGASSTVLSSPTPLRVTATAAPLVSLSAGVRHTCGLTRSSSVVCWGSNASGQLGSATPGLPLEDLGTSVVHVAAGHNHSCAVTTAGQALCWGDNMFGQLGDGTHDQRHTPRQVTGLGSGVTALGAGGWHTCAVQHGKALCWGDDRDGQLGDGTAGGTRAVPAPVVGLATVVDVRVGSGTGCATSAVGDTWCWGANQDGQLGDGTATSRTAPRAVVGLAGAVAEAAPGRWHSCFRRTDGAVLCSGSNLDGRLGTGDLTASLVPVRVVGLG